MSKFVNPTKVITGPNTLWSYVHVFQPNSINGSTPKYSIALIFRKDSPDIPKIRAAIQAAYDEGISKLKGNGKVAPALTALKTPLRDGDAEHPGEEVYSGTYYLNANSSTKPGVVDRDMNPIIDPEEVFSGCRGKASINFYCFNTNGNKGIAASINNLMLCDASGPRLGGKASAAEDFAEDDDDPLA